MKDLKETLILTHSEIHQKITRMAWQILENNYDANRIVLIGVEKKGSLVAELIYNVLTTITEVSISIGSVFVDKENPTLESIKLSSIDELIDVNVVLIDDVLNSGKTLMYATLPILAQGPRKLQTAILANRDHTRFPIKADFVGISLATTLQEHIQFTKDKSSGEMSVHLI